MNLTSEDTTIISSNLDKNTLNLLKNDKIEQIEETDVAKNPPIFAKSVIDNKQKAALSFEVDETLNYLTHENIEKLNKSSLKDLKETVSLELLWIQQAIQSRLQVSFEFFL